MSHKTHILIVDDNLINRQYFSMSLNKSGHLTAVAESGFRAISMAKKRTFDVVLMDIRMSDMDGCETANYIRQLPNYAETPILAVSAEPISDEQQAIFDGFILKPVSPKQLAEAIQASGQNKTHAIHFNQQGALQYAYDDKQIMTKLLKLFIQDLPVQLLTLNTALDNDDATLSRDIIHKLKGSCRTCGADVLDQQLDQLSEAIKNENSTAILSLKENIKSNASLLTNEINHYLEQKDKF